MAGVEGRLAATDLRRRKDNLVARFGEQRFRVRHGLGKDEIAEAGGEELDLQAARPSW